MGEKAKPTPGPWYIVTHNGRMTVKGPGAISLADIYHPPAGDGLTNAHLIAAAPDLLAAARRALAVLRAQGESVRSGNVLGALDAAITRAEGRS